MENKRSRRKKKTYELYDASRNERLLEIIKETPRLNSYSKSVARTNPNIGLKSLREKKEDNYYHHSITNTSPNNNVVLPVINTEPLSPSYKGRRRYLYAHNKEETDKNSNTPKASSNEDNYFNRNGSKAITRSVNKFPTYNGYQNNNVFGQLDLFNSNNINNSNNYNYNLNSPKESLSLFSKDYNRNNLRDSDVNNGDNKLRAYNLSPPVRKIKLVDKKMSHDGIHSLLSNNNTDGTVIKLMEAFKTESTKDTLIKPTEIKESKDNDNNTEDVFNIVAYFSQSQAGKKYKKITKTNQDSFLECPSLFNNKDVNLFGVLDGHGMYGEIISQFVVKFLKNYFNNDRELNNAAESTQSIYQILTENDYEKIKNAFISAEKALVSKINEIDSNYSGTTCVLVFQVGNNIICANAGDSRAILVRDRKIIIPLSTDHKPEIEAEKMRILSNGGEVAKDEEYGPYRVWAKGQNAPGIAMSRSIGDLLASSLGVIPLPEIKEYKLDDNCKYIIIASDGVWEFLTNERVTYFANKLYKYNNPESICESLIEKSTEKWEKEDEVIDDITVITILF